MGIYWTVFFIVLISTFATILIIHQINLSNIRKQQESINKKANDSLANMDFKVTKTFYLNDYATLKYSNSCKKFISIDDVGKKICLIDYNKGSLIVVNMNEILNYEIYENGSNQTVGGNAGGLWAGLFAAETSGLCKELKLIIRLNRYDVSQVCYEIIFNTLLNTGISKADATFKQYINSMQEVVSFLEVVISENKKK